MTQVEPGTRPLMTAVVDKRDPFNEEEFNSIMHMARWAGKVGKSDRTIVWS